jgi:hypothetical protein
VIVAEVARASLKATAAGVDRSRIAIDAVNEAALELRGVHAGRLAALLRRNALVVGAWAFYVVVALIAIPAELVQDSWMTLVGGREVVQHGLPTHDHFAAWTAGVPWIDQQWLAQLAFYALYVAGGLKLVLLSHVALLAAALAIALAAARLSGASEKSVCLVALATMLSAPWELQLRAQTVGTLLFVCVTALLLADSRRPSRRVLLVLPLLAVWANVHGTVLLGVALATLRGAAILVERRGPRLRLLLLAAPLCAFASPYGFSLAHYYPRIVANPLMTKFVNEWRASTPSRATVVFFLLAFLTVWLVARASGRLTGFEKLALVVTLTGALWAIRSITWFALTDLMVLPLALDAALPSRRARPRFAQLRLLAGAGAVAAVLVGTGVAAAQPRSWYASTWPERALPALRSATADPSTRAFVDDRYADWLVWHLPELRGRIAYDVRFELFDARQFHLLSEFKARAGDGWRRAAAGYPLLVFDLATDRPLWRAYRRDRGARVLYADRLVGVVALARERQP